MTIELKYRVSEASLDTCNYGMNFLNKNLEKIVEKSCPGTGERIALYRMKEGRHSRTVAAVEAYMRNARKGDYDFYVLLSGRVNELKENESLKTFKRALDNAVGKNGRATDVINYRENPALPTPDRRKTRPSNDRRLAPRTVNQIFSGNFSLDVQNLLMEYNSGTVDNLTERMDAIKSYYAPKPKKEEKGYSFIDDFLGFLFLP